MSLALFSLFNIFISITSYASTLSSKKTSGQVQVSSQPEQSVEFEETLAPDGSVPGDNDPDNFDPRKNDWICDDRAGPPGGPYGYHLRKAEQLVNPERFGVEDLPGVKEFDCYRMYIDGPAHVRDKPNGKILHTLPTGMEVHVHSELNGWYYIHPQVFPFVSDMKKAFDNRIGGWTHKKNLLKEPVKGLKVPTFQLAPIKMTRPPYKFSPEELYPEMQKKYRYPYKDGELFPKKK